MARGCLNREGFQFVYEAGHTMLGEDSALGDARCLSARMYSSTFVHSASWRRLKSRSEKSRPLTQM